MPQWKKQAPTIKRGAQLPEAEGKIRRAELEGEIRAGIEEGLTAKVKIGKALWELGPAGSALYRYTHTDFGEYCESIGINKRTARMLMQDWSGASSVMEHVKIGTICANNSHLLSILTDDAALRALGKEPSFNHKPILAKMEADKEPPTPEAIRRVAKVVKPPPPVVQKPKKLIDKKRRKLGQRVMHNLRMVYRGLQDAGLVGPFDKRLKELAKEIEAAFLGDAA